MPDDSGEFPRLYDAASMYWVCFVLSKFIGKDKEDILDDLVDVSSNLGELPDNETVISEYLSQYGIERNAFRSNHKPRLWELLAEMKRKEEYDKILIFQGKYFSTLLFRFPEGNCDIIVDENGYYKEKYYGKGIYVQSYYSLNSKKIIISKSNNQFQKQKKLSEKNKKSVIYTEANSRFKYYNPNPTDANIGDCGTRAICVALNKSWKETVKIVSKISHRKKLPYVHCYEDALLEHGFSEFLGPRDKWHRISIKKFFEQKSTEKYYKNRICFVVRGLNYDHMVTAKLVGEEYKLYDTWDSSKRYIEKYFVSKK